jgi:hypothetical protein
MLVASFSADPIGANEGRRHFTGNGADIFAGWCRDTEHPGESGVRARVAAPENRLSPDAVEPNIRPDERTNLYGSGFSVAPRLDLSLE